LTSVNCSLKSAGLFLYDRQTDAEKFAEFTAERNAMGFNSVDAEFLSSVCSNAERFESVTDGQAPYVRRQIKKYWKQVGPLLDPSDEESI
jgi:hypothetical protein